MKIKGLVLHSRKQFVQEHFGAEAWTQVLEALSPEDREALGEVIFAAKWYPFETGERVDRAIVDVLGGGKESVFEEMGARSAARSLAKEHETFLIPGNPQAFMKKANTVYKFYYDTGYREYEATGPNSGVMTTFEAQAFSAADCATVIGWYKEALGMCGARNVEIDEESCRARGDAYCRYRFRWEI